MFNIQRIVFFFYVTGGNLRRRTYDLFGWSSTKLLRLVVGSSWNFVCLRVHFHCLLSSIQEDDLLELCLIP